MTIQNSITKKRAPEKPRRGQNGGSYSAGPNASDNPNPSAPWWSIEGVVVEPFELSGGHAEEPSDKHVSSIEINPPNVTCSMPNSMNTAYQPQLISQPQHSSRRPLVYPALLSCVAEAFRQRVSLVNRTKDGLTYPAAFDGREAVDLIAYIIKTSDRNLALLLGRALGAQRFFHAVTYDHHLYDTPLHIYQLSATLPFAPWDTKGKDDESALPLPGFGNDFVNMGEDAAVRKDTGLLPVGIFTLLSYCYSPTCISGQPCYSSRCPRRSRRPEGSTTKPSTISGKPKEPKRSWAQSISNDVLNGMSDQEKMRQQAIFDIIFTEREFVRDLEYLRDHWIEPLRAGDVISQERREEFLHQVFWNFQNIFDISFRLCELLTKRQDGNPIVETIGDIFMEMLPHFKPFVEYAKHQPYGKYEFKAEESTNPGLARFVEIVERLPQGGGLELSGHLAKPIVRLAQHPQLLETVFAHTPVDNADRIEIPKALEMFQELLTGANEGSRKTENRIRLLQLDKTLLFRPDGEVEGLKLTDNQRQLVYEGPLGRYRGVFNCDLLVFLFDHALLMVKNRVVNMCQQLKVYKRPIPLQLLSVSTPINRTTWPRKGTSRNVSYDSTVNSPPSPNVPTVMDSPTNGYQLVIAYLGRQGFSLTLWASTPGARKEWVERIAAQQEVLRKRDMVFDTHILSEGVFLNGAEVNCAVPYDNGQRVLYGTNNGVYLQTLHEDRLGIPTKKIELTDVKQIDILEDYDLLVVLSEKSVLTFPTAALEENNPIKFVKRIASYALFFGVGHCLGRTLVCTAKVNRSNTVIKALEPIDPVVRDKNKSTFQKLLHGRSDNLKAFKEFYIPIEAHSIQFLKTKLCLATTAGFEIVILETLETQALLDPEDASLDFVGHIKDVRPLSIYRIGREILLCYTTFAFYVDTSGKRCKEPFIIHWKGTPASVAFHYPYIVGFSLTLLEVWHVEDGALIQVIQANDLRLLFNDTMLSPVNSSQVAYQRGQLPTYEHGRDKIILVSDDRVMELRLAITPSSQGISSAET